ncbi:DNA internalization-related competence protein ComEC/Rec2 [Hydrogenophaga sp.]|uniref:DNA internalization-related competence protein ComEC/Rec2 n=1 Tax=Hydrogenophaga sp. TaxID=1904254 RepID=UPI003566047F
MGWVLGVALQLQQASLWPFWIYGLMVVLALLAMAVPLLVRWRSPANPVRWRPAMQALALLAGVALGFGLTGARSEVYLSQALQPELERVDLVVTGRVASMPQRSPQGERFDFQVEAAQLDGHSVVLPERVQLAWNSWGGRGQQGAASPGLGAGERWRFVVRLRRPHGNANPHGFDRERWLWEQGIQATGYVKTGARDPTPALLGKTAWHPVAAARQQVVQAIEQRVAEPRSAGVLAALVAGDQAAIERSDWDLFRTTGVAHLMSISGLHVTMFAWLAMALVRWSWRRLAGVVPGLLLACPAPRAAAVGGLSLALVYAVFSGWGVPSQRTLLMLAVVLFLRLGARQWPWPAVWLLAMAAVLLLDPWALMQAGFWLSFVAVGILFSTDPGRRVGAERAAAASAAWGRRSLRAGLALLREQAVVTVALAPLTLMLFGQFSVVGLAANLLAIPWVTLLVTPLAMLGVLVPPVWDLAAWAVRALIWVLAAWADWPWASVHRAIAPLPLAVAAVLGGMLLVLRLPWALRLGGVLLLWPALLWTPPRPAPGEFELLALDVGQGGAVLVRTASHTLLYDTGPRYASGGDAGQQVVVPLLRAMGEQPDTVLVSHRDSDHAGGSDSVRAAFPAAQWLSSFDADAQRRCLAGQRWEWDGVVFELLHPEPQDYAPGDGRRRSSNAMSCVLRVHNPQQSAWLAGDIEAAQEVRLALAYPDLRASVMLAPHHGSQSSSSPVLLNVLRPQWVVIQSGYLNPFHHPAPLVLDRYRERGMAWVASPECGAAWWRSWAPEQMQCQRDAQRRYWNHRPDGRMGAN